MIPNIEDLKEPPVVGKYYMVPCVEVTSGASGLTVGWWPVTGTQHEDAEVVGFKPRHWHYDFRFLTANQHKQKWLERGSVLTVAQDWGGGLTPVPGIIPKTLHQKRRCMRAQSEFPRARAGWLKELEGAYADKRVTCGKCPHRGLPLESLPREPGTDNVVCPGHGLRWDLKTGQLVR